MVDSPVGKKCRECVRPRHHLAESAPKHLLLAFVVALAVALPTSAVMHQLSILILPAAIFGYVVAEAALWAGKRQRTLAMQLVAGGAALLGALLSAGIHIGPSFDLETGQVIGQGVRFFWRFNLFMLINIAIGVASAVGRVRFW
jgi:hypothetical protein